MSCDEGNQFFWMDTEQHFQKAIRTFHVSKKMPSSRRPRLELHYVFTMCLCNNMSFHVEFRYFDAVVTPVAWAFFTIRS